MISPLLTDLYQLTMAYGYWKLGMHNNEAVFHQIFRNHPFQGNYAVACGLASVVEFLRDFRFSADDLAYLKGLSVATNEPLFSLEFLDYLSTLTFTCDVDAIPEGTVVFANEPLLRIKGPLLQGQLLESILLNLVNFQTLIATKASRVYQAAQGDAILEFGLRRAQGPDGALSASRAAYIGGCSATSNVLAGKYFDIPVRGTHAHSWVTAFKDELTAFAALAQVLPQNAILLVDTYDSIEGVKHAIEIGHTLRAKGADLQGIRLDSGDLALLSIKARALLDAAGFTHTKIIASNNLDEYVIAKLKKDGAAISVWGVGTHLVTAYDQPALDGVYKLSALRELAAPWQYKLKLSEQTAKISNPGIYQVRRYFADDLPLMDVMYDVELGLPKKVTMVAYDAPFTMTELPDGLSYQDLLVPVFRQGQCVLAAESIHAQRARSIHEVTQFLQKYPAEHYPVGLEKEIHTIKQTLINEVSLK